MQKIIYFDEVDKKCIGEAYSKFIDYAFENTDYFMLVYVNYYGKGYTKTMRYFRDALKSYKVKSRSNPSWPGTPGTYCMNTTYKVVFYKTDPAAKEILKEVEGISTWSCPSHPQDLAFFKGNVCWFYSVGHEEMAAIIHASKKDLDFVEENGLAERSDAYPYPPNEDFDIYNEKLQRDER
ncbi:MAG: hypothetical protein HFE78_05145 [Clostridiales bacterium]|nr:hypothetical protein [Clostridiales bacterium]